MPYQGPGIYEHYKGGFYEVLGLAVREETLQAENPVVEVVYKPVKSYDREEEFVTRRREVFDALIRWQNPDNPVYRFRFVTPFIEFEGPQPESHP